MILTPDISIPKIEYPSPSTVLVTWTIPALEVDHRLSLAEREVIEKIEAFEKNKEREWKKKKTRARVKNSHNLLNGFRPNKAPHARIWREHGKQIQEKMLRAICPELWEELAKSTPFHPIKAPHFSGHPEYGKNLELTAETEIFPRLLISSEKYRMGLRVTIPAKQLPTDKVVKRYLEDRRKYFVKFTLVESGQPIQMGDYVSISFVERRTETEVWGERKGIGIIVGEGQINPQIEKEIIGMKTGEGKMALLGAPNGQQIESSFQIEDHKRSEMPTDEELCRTEGKPCLFDLICRYREIIEERFETKFMANFRRAVMGRIIGNEKVSLPKSMIDARYQMFEQEARIQAMKANTAYDDSPEMCTRLRQLTEMVVCEEIILYQIAEQENIIADDADVEKEVLRIAEHDGHTVEEARQWLATGNFMEGARQQARIRKTLDWLKERTNVTEEVVI